MTDNLEEMSPAQMAAVIRLQQAMLARQERELAFRRTSRERDRQAEPPAKPKRFAGMAALVTAAAVVALLWVAL
jgi:hypothetical protein